MPSLSSFVDEHVGLLLQDNPRIRDDTWFGAVVAMVPLVIVSTYVGPVVTTVGTTAVYDDGTKVVPDIRSYRVEHRVVDMTGHFVVPARTCVELEAFERDDQDGWPADHFRRLDAMATGVASVASPALVERLSTEVLGEERIELVNGCIREAELVCVCTFV